MKIVSFHWSLRVETSLAIQKRQKGMTEDSGK